MGPSDLSSLQFSSPPSVIITHWGMLFSKGCEIKLLFRAGLSSGCSIYMANVVLSDPRVRSSALFIIQGDGGCL